MAKMDDDLAQLMAEAKAAGLMDRTKQSGGTC
jgi:hypothetical protein